MTREYEQIREAVLDRGFPAYRYGQLLQTVFKRRIGEFEHMDILPLELRVMLKERFGRSFCSVSPITEKTSKQARKILFGLADGGKIEAVGMRFKKGWEYFCISSQCGCGFGCKFCATGEAGFDRNLTAKEITDQLLYFLLNGHNLDSVSFMGMGEPLANPNIFEALALLTDASYFGLSQRKITISTVGILPAIKKLAADFPQINLAYSLHSPFEKERGELIPANRIYPLHEALDVLNEYIQKTRRRLFIAYTLIKNTTDTARHANALAELLKSRLSFPHLYYVNLIPYNPACITATKFEPSTQHRMKQFAGILRSKGVNVLTRAQFGSDIEAGCGQLYGGG